MIDDPTVQGIILNLHDVTEREEAQKELRAVFDAALNPMFIADDDGRYVDVNAAGARLLGMDRWAIIGKKTFELFPLGAEYAQAWEEFKRIGSVSGELVVGSGDAKRIFELRGTAHVLPGRHMSLLHEVTAPRKAEAALTASEQRFRVLVESSADVVCTTDGETITYLSPSVTCVLGFTPEELVGTKLLDLLHPRIAARTRATCGRSFARPRPRASDVRRPPCVTRTVRTGPSRSSRATSSPGQRSVASSTTFTTSRSESAPSTSFAGARQRSARAAPCSRRRRPSATSAAGS